MMETSKIKLAKWFKIMCFILALCLLFASCGDTTVPSDTSEENVEYLLIDLPQLSKQNQRIYYTAWGNLTTDSFDDTVMVFADNPSFEAIHADTYMLADISGKILTYNLGEWDQHVLQNGVLLIENVDADEAEEIILNTEMTGNGGTLAQVFSVQDESIQLQDDLNDKEIEIDGEFLDDYKLKLTNDSLGFTAVVDMKEIIQPECFDESGKANVRVDIMVRPIHSCFVKDKQIHCKRDINANGRILPLIMTFSYDEAGEQFVPTHVALDESHP